MKTILETLKRKWAEYLLEILVITVGIIGAFALNNWNENRITKNTEQSYLIALKEEFTYNKSQLERVMLRNSKNIDSAVVLANCMSPDEPEIDEIRFGSLYKGAIFSEVQYRPSNGVLNEIISSGKLGIFSNQELRRLLSAWDGILVKVRYQEQEHANPRMKIHNLWSLKGNGRKVLVGSSEEMFGIQRSKFQKGNLNLLQSEQFDHHLVGYIITARFLNDDYYGELEEEIDKILIQIQENLDTF